MKNWIVVGALCLSLGSCAWKPYKLETKFSEQNLPKVPNYASKEAWAALPSEKDNADSLPMGFVDENRVKTKTVDVFFLHPTIYTGEPNNQYDWNASLDDAKLNTAIDASTILNQASAFGNGTRVFAPRYRQAHYYSFVTTDKESSTRALNLAYQDVKTAFEFYLQNHNQGRPIVIAAHSQGTMHAKRLLKEYFDGKPLQKQLVEAYLIGIAIQPDAFENIKPSTTANDFGGFVSWNTFHTGFYPVYYKNGLHTAVCTNPISWQQNETFVSNLESKGGVGQKYTFAPNAADAQCKTGLLWIKKPYVRGRALLRIKIWHKADINLFWADIWQNVALRTENYLKNAK